MSIVTRIMQHPHSEVLLTFMYEETIRFLTPQTGGYSAISQPISKIWYNFMQFKLSTNYLKQRS